MSATQDAITKWTGARIPYDPVTLNQHPARDRILAAMSQIEQASKVRFCPRGGDPDYIYFTHDESTSNRVEKIGMMGGRQFVNIKKDGHWALHELGHILGFIHEQDRDDRASYFYQFEWPKPRRATGFGISGTPSATGFDDKLYMAWRGAGAGADKIYYASFDWRPVSDSTTARVNEVPGRLPGRSQSGVRTLRPTCPASRGTSAVPGRHSPAIVARNDPNEQENVVPYEPAASSTARP